MGILEDLREIRETEHTKSYDLASCSLLVLRLCCRIVLNEEAGALRLPHQVLQYEEIFRDAGSGDRPSQAEAKEAKSSYLSALRITTVYFDSRCIGVGSGEA
jgi:hypothetical protein